jgi:two-component system, NarL family, sensor histidine kinase DesK
MSSAFWTPPHPRWIMVAGTLAVTSTSPLFTVLGTPGEPGVHDPVIPIACGGALAALQLRHSFAAARGVRPRGGVWTLLIMAALVFVPMHWYTWNWLAMVSLLTASAAMVLRSKASVIAPVMLLTGAVISAAVIVFQASGRSLPDLLFELQWWGIGLPLLTTCLYGVAWLVRAADELQVARTELAEAAVSQERLRVSRDLHDLLGQSLSAVSLKGDLALRLLTEDPAAAQAEIHSLTATARDARTDLYAVTSATRTVDLRTELDGAATLLAAAGIVAHVEVSDTPLRATAEEMLGWAVREGVTNILRHSRASSCSIIIERLPGGRQVTLEIVNDGVRQPYQPGHGLSGLGERVRALHGEMQAGPAADGSFQLLVRLPEEGT